MIVFIQKFYYLNFRLINFYNLRYINLWILFVSICITAISCAMLYSTSDGSFYPWATKQIVYFFVSLVVVAIVVVMNPRLIARCSYLLYFFALFLLVVVKFAGHSSMGAQRWIDLRIFNLQPSEIIKVAVILILAEYFEKISAKFNSSWFAIFPPFFIVAVPFSLVVVQPDLATSIIILSISCAMIFVSGISIKNFIFGGIILLVSLPIIWSRMHDYQKNRILNFIDPDKDPFGSGYNIIQSKIAIGSGGILGKGFMHGCQSQLNFLPENHTDFVFSVFAEEFGLVGCMVLFFLYSFIICYGLFISFQAKSIFLKMTSFGASCFFFFHVIINAGMTTGIMPAAGVPMPMLSYGGSSFVISMFCIGLILNADIYRKNV